jgi:hypothetical protein
MIPDGDKRTFWYHKRASSTTQLNIETYVIYVEIHVLYGGSYAVFVFPFLQQIQYQQLLSLLLNCRSLSYWTMCVSSLFCIWKLAVVSMYCQRN